MADPFTKEQRSEVMRLVKSSGNKSTEGKLISYFKERGIKGWRRNYPVTGKPDFVFLKEKIAVFTDGCFWHGHDCRNLKPRANEAYWRSKQKRNKERDIRITDLLLKRGWRVVRLWECELKKPDLDRVFSSFFTI
jgi:DNA mismatch endonuclease (patch repair protein)